MAKKESTKFINSEDITSVTVTATFELDVCGNLEQTMADIRKILDHINSKAEMDASDVSMVLEAKIKETKIGK